MQLGQLYGQNYEEVDNIMANTVTTGVRKSYTQLNVHFIEWLINNEPHLLDDTSYTLFLAAKEEDGEDAMRESIKECLDSGVVPVILYDLTAHIFVQYLLDVQRDDGTYLSLSSYESRRSALTYLFTVKDQRMSPDLKDGLSKGMKGLARKIASLLQRSGGRAKVGKEPLTYEAYRKLCQIWVSSGSQEHIFAHSFLTLTWNLLC
jgi:hypothetical protein